LGEVELLFERGHLCERRVAPREVCAQRLRRLVRVLQLRPALRGGM
jgi:hypothetical protein